MSEISGANLNIRYITSPGTYIVRDNDDVINCDTTNGGIDLQLQNITQSGLLLNLRTVFVNDIGGKSATSNITIHTTGKDTVNGSSSVAISVNNGQLSFDVAGNTEWIAVGNGISSSGGSSGGGVFFGSATIVNATQYAVTFSTLVAMGSDQILNIKFPNANSANCNVVVTGKSGVLGTYNLLKFGNAAFDNNDTKANQILSFIWDGINLQCPSVTDGIAQTL